MLIPLPFVTALVCALLAVRLAAVRSMPMQARVILVGIAVLTALGSVLVGIRFGYGVEWVARVHRLVPLMLGPALFLGFEAMRGPIAAQRYTLHFGLAVAAAVVFSIWSAPLDLAIGLSYLAYWLLLLRQHQEGSDGFAALPTDVTDQMHRWRRGALVLLAAIFVLENAIALSFMLKMEGIVPNLIAYGSLPITAVLFLAALNLKSQNMAPPASAQQGDLSDIEAYLTKSELFRDPDVTLSALARGLGAPIKSVSRRINAATGKSVSLYINDWRIDAAARALAETNDKVEVVGQDCGFLSRSNFYREFQRVHGTTPAAYRKENRAKLA